MQRLMSVYYFCKCVGQSLVRLNNNISLTLWTSDAQNWLRASSQKASAREVDRLKNSKATFRALRRSLPWWLSAKKVSWISNQQQNQKRKFGAWAFRPYQLSGSSSPIAWLVIIIMLTSESLAASMEQLEHWVLHSGQQIQRHQSQIQVWYFNLLWDGTMSVSVSRKV